MKVNIQVQCATKSLNQRYRASAGCLFRIACLLDQMGGDDAIDYPEHLARDHRTAGQRLSFLDFNFFDFAAGKIKPLKVRGIPEDDLGTPAFSPDGEFILFEVGDEDRRVGMAYADAREEGVVMGKIIAYEPRWSPVAVP